MVERMSFSLSRGYLSKTVLTENEAEMDEGIVSRMLLELSSLEIDKIECYHKCLPSGYTDAEMVFDYLIMYKTDDGYKPIVIKNGVHQLSRPYEWFEKYYEDDVSDDEYNKRFDITECDETELNELKKTEKIFTHKYFGSASYTLNELLDLVCESYREKFHEFLEEKYSEIIKQDVLLFKQ